VNTVEFVMGTDDLNTTTFVRDRLVPSSSSYVLFDNGTVTDQVGLYSNLQVDKLYLKIDGCAIVVVCLLYL
jgi:hypothetical protein